ncbi:hypothetical protein BDW22DRAFT_1427203 [Trametopsis cervina]|nr:hypothetical protein BDW22DRAFT_1427203 [Trametopsis cervina]
MSSTGDATLLSEIGTDVLRSFVSVVVETFVVAIYTVLVCKAAFILLDKSRRGHFISRATLAIVLALYIMDLSLWIIDVHNVVVEVDNSFVRALTPGGTLADRHAQAGKTQLRLGLVEDVVYAYMVLLGDAIMFWRVYAFWRDGRERVVLILPCLVFTATLVLSCLVTFCASSSDANLQFGSFTHPPFCRNIQSASYWVQFFTAAVATGLIGIKTWRYRRMIQPALRATSSGHRFYSPVHRITTVLIDSGIFYMLFFAAEAILGVNGLNAAVAKSAGLSFALEVYQYTTSSIVGIYPTLVVILVHSPLVLVDQHGNTLTNASTLRFGNGSGIENRKRSGARAPTATTTTMGTGRTGAAWTDGTESTAFPDAGVDAKTGGLAFGGSEVEVALTGPDRMDGVDGMEMSSVRAGSLDIPPPSVSTHAV